MKNVYMIHKKRNMAWRSALCAILLLALSPAVIPADDYPALRDSRDPLLQQQLEQLIRHRGLRNAVAQERLAVAVVDISNRHKPRMAAVNGDTMEYAASLPKLAILLAAFVEIEAGTLELTTELREDMTRMIRHSSNVAATRVLDQVGRERLLEILQLPRFMFYDKRYGGGLWVGKAYAKAGAYQRDPLHNISHGATVIQGARFYYLLETGQLVNPELTREMKTILSRPAINHKFVKGLQSRPGATIYRKSGTWKNFHADSALVEYQQHSYIIVGLAEDRRGSEWLTDLAPRLHDLVVSDPQPEAD